MPFLPAEVKQTASDIISNHMELQLRQGAAQLYEGALETLAYLKNKGYTLVFLSNCKIYYKEGHNKLFGLDKYFTSLVGSEEYNYIPKYEILKLIRPDYPEEMVMIGDRIHDIEAGKKNGIYTIGCNYGYSLPGELEVADYRINNISELRKLL
jgi:phosphoglycolate phosphatase